MTPGDKAGELPGQGQQSLCRGWMLDHLVTASAQLGVEHVSSDLSPGLHLLPHEHALRWRGDHQSLHYHSQSAFVYFATIAEVWATVASWGPCVWVQE